MRPVPAGPGLKFRSRFLRRGYAPVNQSRAGRHRVHKPTLFAAGPDFVRSDVACQQTRSLSLAGGVSVTSHRANDRDARASGGLMHGSFQATPAFH